MKQNNRINRTEKFYVVTRSCLFALVFLTAGLAVSGCKKAAGPPGAARAAFAVQAVVVEARAQAVSESLSLVGTVAPTEMVEIKSETDGTVQEVPFQEGQEVKQGDLLLLLDESNRLNHTWMLRDNMVYALSYLTAARLKRVEICLMPSHAWQHPDASREFMLANAQEMNQSVIDAHISLYVNERTYDLGDEGYAAAEELLSRAAAHGLVPSVPRPLR